MIACSLHSHQEPPDMHLHITMHVGSSHHVSRPTRAQYLVNPFKMGMYEAMAMMAKLKRMGAGAFNHCSLRPTPVTNSAARADVMPSMARRPLMVSGAGPSKACASATHKIWSSNMLQPAGHGIEIGLGLPGAPGTSTRQAYPARLAVGWHQCQRVAQRSRC